MDKNRWLESVLKEIHFVPDRKQIGRELADHLEDAADYYKSQGESPEDAEKKSILSMGDPQLIGKELNTQHKPFLGYVWILSRVLLPLGIGFLVFSVIFTGFLSLKNHDVSGLEELYKSKISQYEGLQHQAIDHSEALGENIITFKDFFYNPDEQTLTVLITVSGKGSFNENGLHVRYNDVTPSYISSYKIDEQADDAGGVYIVGLENFSWPKDNAINVTYNLYGLGFDFVVRTHMEEGDSL